ncbi:hypothetical protein LG003_21200 [Photorhabdus kleinii]|nr:hypothetical protein [Photorhabdus kleinii]
MNRPQRQDMLQPVRTGDTIVVHSLDRLCRIKRERYQVNAGLL